MQEPEEKAKGCKTPCSGHDAAIVIKLRAENSRTGLHKNEHIGVGHGGRSPYCVLFLTTESFATVFRERRHCLPLWMC